jgi:hypothetical protein
MLVELMVVLILLGAFSLIFADAISIALKAQRNARSLDVRSMEADILVAALRRDTWSASALRVEKDSRLEITQPDGRTIVWEDSSDGKVTRTESTAPGDMENWNHLPPVRFMVRGPLLTLEIAAPQRGEGDATPAPEQATFVSQRLLAGGSQ